MSARIWLGIVFCSVGSLSCFFGSASAAVIISEIMYEIPGADDDREWVELYNTGNAAVDLSGWQLRDEDGGSAAAGPIPNGTMIGPNQALVLIETEAAFLAEWGAGINYVVYSGMGTTLNLANSPAVAGDEVLRLLDNNQVLVDEVDYLNVSPWPLLTNATGTSIYLLPGFLSTTANDLGQNWARATAGVNGAYQALDGGIEAGSPGTVVPEPASMVLALAGFALVAFGKRKF